MEEVNNQEAFNTPEDREDISKLRLIIWIIVWETEVGPQVWNWWFCYHNVWKTRVRDLFEPVRQRFSGVPLPTSNKVHSWE